MNYVVGTSGSGISFFIKNWLNNKPKEPEDFQQVKAYYEYWLLAAAAAAAAC